jgi:Zn-dependent protease
VEPREIAILFGCLFVAVILHEVSHGVVALWFGDDTAKRAGRLTLNPIPHIDPFGSIILPAMGALAGFPAFGYAKPVPVNPAQLRNPRRDMLYVSLAGPTTNFLLMAISAVVARSLYSNGAGLGTSIAHPTPDLLLEVVFYFAVVNLLLGVFNLLPIPPLDGSGLVERAMPHSWLPTWYQYRQYGFLVLMVLIFFTNVLGTIISPFYDMLYRFVTGG